MSRDVLLALLALALLLNLALLGAATLRPRRGPAAGDDRGRARSGGDIGGGTRAWRTETPRRAAASRTLPVASTTARPGARLFVPAAPGNGSGYAPPPQPARAMAAVLASPRAERRVGVAPFAPPAPVPPVAPVPPRPVAPVPRVKPAEPAAVAQATPPEPGPQPEPARSKSHRTRGRRFVLPPLDEDQDRSAAAIEAFLGGEPPIGTTTERPQRRRHRARRPTGSPMPRTTMLVWLQGFGELDRVVGTARASHVSNAFFDALRRLARTTDEIREVGTGRVRVIIDADDAGASAYVERARSSVQPWLELLTVPLRVETGARESTEVFPFGTTRRIAGDH